MRLARMTVIGSWMWPLPAGNLAQHRCGSLDLVAFGVVIARQFGVHAVENILVGGDLVGQVPQNEVVDVHRGGSFPVRTQRLNMVFDRWDVGGVGPVETATGALEPDGQAPPPAFTFDGSMQLPKGAATDRSS